MILAEVEQRTNKPAASLFDLMAGTSTGGIISLALSGDGGNVVPTAYAALNFKAVVVVQVKQGYSMVKTGQRT